MRRIDADALKKTLGDWIIAHYTDTFTGDDAGLVFAHLIDRTETIDKGEKEMNKYSEIEIQIANNLLIDGYKWLVRTMYGNVVAFSCKPCKNEGYWVWPNYGESEVVSGKSAPLFQNIQWEDPGPTYIEDIVNPQILNDSEKKYLSAVIKPFRDRVSYICKVNTLERYWTQRIDIGFTDENINIKLPIFERGTMYKGMKIGKEYTLEELGI